MSKYAYWIVTKSNNKEENIYHFGKQFNVPLSNIMFDIQSNKDSPKRAYNKLVSKLHERDLLYIKSLSNLGDTYQDITDQWNVLTKEIKIDIIVLDIPLLDTTKYKDNLGSFISDLTFQILSFVIEKEMKTKERRQRGIDLAKKKGVKFGRPKKELPIEVFKQYLNHSITIAEIQVKYEIGCSTFYRKLQDYRNSISNTSSSNKEFR